MMKKQFHFIISAITILLSSCLKQSIPDAMLGLTGKHSRVTASLNYEINGNPVTVTVDDADNQTPGYRTLECVKSSGYVLSALTRYGEFVYTFYADSLMLTSYNYSRSYGPLYVTDFEGPDYVDGPTDYMNFDITQYKDGHISGTFSGQLTPKPNDIAGTPGSVIIRNGSFTNIPVFY